MSLKVSVIIANWNGEAIIEACLHSIFEQTKGVSFEVMVVDDASTDKSVELIRAKFPQVRLIENEQNLGYAATNNRALPIARGEYLFLLNNDTILRNDAISIMATYLDKHPTVGVCGGTLLNPDGTPQHSFGNFPSISMELVGLFSLHRFYRHAPAPALGIVPKNIQTPLETDMIVGADLMIRAELARELGLYDEAYNAYFEDTDMCFRVKQKGLKVVYLPEPKITHLYSYSFNKASVEDSSKITRKAAHMAKGYKRFCKKHYAYGNLIIAIRILTQVRLWIQHSLISFFTSSTRSKELAAEYRSALVALLTA
ncbi:MAG: glycosyltransferase family 2 protein [Chlorobiales bacterium]